MISPSSSLATSTRDVPWNEWVEREKHGAMYGYMGTLARVGHA